MPRVYAVLPLYLIFPETSNSGCGLLCGMNFFKTPYTGFGRLYLAAIALQPIFDDAAKLPLFIRSIRYSKKIKQNHVQND